MAIGNKIFDLRKSHKLSQEKLAEKIGVTRQTISNWELNESSPDLKQAKLLAEVFSVSLDELVENDLKNVFIDKANTSNLNVTRLNKIVFSLFLTMFVLMVTSIIVLLSINNNLMKGNYSSKRHRCFEILIECTEGDDKLIASVSASDYEKMKKLYEEKNGTCRLLRNNSRSYSERKD